MAVLQRATENPPAASSSSTSQWPTSQWQTSWSSWKPTSSEKWWRFRFLGKNSSKSTGEQTGHPLTIHICAVQFVHKRGTRTTRLAQGRPGQELHCHLCALEKSLVIWCYMSHLLLLSHLPFTTSASSSLFTLLSTTTQEHHDQPPRTPSYITHISKLPQLTSCAIKNHSFVKTLQSGGNPRTTTPTGYDPEELATVLQDKLEKKITELRSPERLGQLAYRIFKYQRRPASNRRCISAIRGSTADSDLEDGELQKMLTSPLYAQKLRWNPMQWSCRRER